MLFLGTGIGLYGGLFYISSITNIFHMFIYILSAIILIFTGFYPRKIFLTNYSSLYDIVSNTINIHDTNVLNKKSETYKILEYPLIILFIINGALFLMCASDLVSIFISIELQSYGLYLLSTIYKNSESATSGGLMYFLLGGLSSCFILLGTSLLYANSGTTNLDNLYVINNISSLIYLPLDNIDSIYNNSNFSTYNNYYIVISLIVMTVGFLFKVSAAPFHFWSPDVYDAIPTIVTSFVAIVAKISIFILLLELVHYLSKSSINYVWTNNLLISSLLSLIIGSILGLSQSRIKRLYAYSTISHLGFILLGLSIHSLESIQAFMFYLIQYSFSNLNAFVILISIGYTYYNYTTGNKNNTNSFGEEISSITNIKYEFEKEKPQIKDNIEKEILEIKDNIEKEILEIKGNFKKELQEIKDDFEKELPTKFKNILKPSSDQENSILEKDNSPIQLISQLKGYFYINPILTLSITITLFSFAGIPPLIGFFGKMMILSAAIDKGYVFMALIAILTSVISAVYYLFIIKEAYFNNTEYSPRQENNIDYTDTLTISNDKHVYYKLSNVVLSNYLSISVSILTLLILLFIFIPVKLLNITSILVLILFNV